MQTIHRLNTELDSLQDKAPPVVGSWIKLNRAIARRVTALMGTTLSGLSGSATKVAGTASTSARKVAGTTESSAKRFVNTAKSEVADLSEDATERLDASHLAARKVAYQQMTKTELYDRAQDLDIEGRSQMTKSQLVGALCAADADLVSTS